MSFTERVPVSLPHNAERLTRWFYVAVAVPTILGMAHHLDHLLRGNHVGWPATGVINEFTYTLAIYPLVAAGLSLTSIDRVGHRFWVWFLAFSALLMGYFHLSPWAVEPPGDVMLPYANPVAGYVAFVVLLALIASALVGSAVVAVMWRRGDA